MKKNDNNKQKKYGRNYSVIIFLFLLFIVALTVGISYAWLKLTINASKSNILRSGSLSLVLDDAISDGINLTNAVPMSDAKGMSLKEYTFSLINNGNTKANYNLYLEDLELDTGITRMNDKYVKYSLIKNDSYTNGGHKTLIEFVQGGWLITYDSEQNKFVSFIVGGSQNDSQMYSFNQMIASAQSEDEAIDILKNSICSSCDYKISTKDYNGSLISTTGSNPNRLLDSGVIKAGKTNSYSLKLWIDSDADNAVMGTVFSGQLRIDATQDTTNYVNFNPELGDYVQMNSSTSSYVLESEKTGYPSDKIIYPEKTNIWRVIDKKVDGTIEMVNDSNISFSIDGNKGYSNEVGLLNEIAKAHENSDFTVSSRNVGYNGQTEYLNSVDFTKAVWKFSTSNNDNEASGGGDIDGYNADLNKIRDSLGTVYATGAISNNGGYLLASRTYYYNSESDYGWSVKSISSGYETYRDLILYRRSTSMSSGFYNTQYAVAARPIVVVKSNLKTAGTGNGSATKPWILE